MSGARSGDSSSEADGEHEVDGRQQLQGTLPPGVTGRGSAQATLAQARQAGVWQMTPEPSTVCRV
jgi:hypothetical protein